MAKHLPRRMYRAGLKPSGSECCGKQFDPFVPGKERGVNEAGLNVCGFQPRIAAQNGGCLITGGQHVEHVFHGEPPPPDDRLTTKDFRVEGDAFDELILIHAIT